MTRTVSNSRGRAVGPVADVSAASSDTGLARRLDVVPSHGRLVPLGEVATQQAQRVVGDVDVLAE